MCKPKPRLSTAKDAHWQIFNSIVEAKSEPMRRRMLAGCVEKRRGAWTGTMSGYTDHSQTLGRSDGLYLPTHRAIVLRDEWGTVFYI
jgi:hypothetical protein